MGANYESKIKEILDVVCSTSGADIEGVDFSDVSTEALRGIVDGTANVSVDVDAILKNAYTKLALNVDFLVKDDFRKFFVPELIQSFEQQIRNRIGSDYTDTSKSIDELQKYIADIDNCVDENQERLQQVVEFLTFCKEKAEEYANEHHETSSAKDPDSGEIVAHQTESLADNSRELKRLEEALANAKKLVEDATIQSNKATRTVATNNISIRKLQELLKDTETEWRQQKDFLDDKVKLAKEQADNAKQQAGSIVPNMLTTLGIFVAVIIAVVACYLNILLANQAKGTLTIWTLKPERVLLVFMLYLLMGHIILSVIFFLMYLISKMTAFRLTCNCNAYVPLNMNEKKPYESSDCRTCNYFYSCDLETEKQSAQITDDATAKPRRAAFGKRKAKTKNSPKTRKQCSIYKRLKKRYPYFVAYNSVFGCLYLILLAAFFVAA